MESLIRQDIEGRQLEKKMNKRQVQEMKLDSEK